MIFVDRVEIECEAGSGGDGCVSFYRTKHNPRGGPDGGDGGHGGSVILLAQHGVNSLVELTSHRRWRAESGRRGGSQNCRGRNGADLILKAPPGTVVVDADEGFVLKDLTADGESLVVARGGKGGYGNERYKSASNRAPREHTPGEPGEKRRVVLELKTIADVGLIGLPNAGKSTLLSRLSRARPEIADYPFTTKFPNLGRVDLGYDRSFVLADIPGLIEGAHAGVGLGHEFLRHIERAGILVHLVEPSPIDGSDPVDNYRSIRAELRQYDAHLAERPEIAAVSKAELPEAEDAAERLAAATGREFLLISAATGKGLDRLQRRIVEELDRRDAA